MLNKFELADLWEFQKSIPDEKIKNLLYKLLFEYGEYIKCGTVDDCINRKEWMTMSLEDVRTGFNSIVRDLREEVEVYKKEIAEQNNHMSKRGRQNQIKED